MYNKINKNKCNVNTPVKEVAFSSALVGLFVCLLVELRRTAQTIFTKFGGKLAHGPQKNPLDHITLGFWLG